MGPEPQTGRRCHGGSRLHYMLPPRDYSRGIQIAPLAIQDWYGIPRVSRWPLRLRGPGTPDSMVPIQDCKGRVDAAASKHRTEQKEHGEKIKNKSHLNQRRLFTGRPSAHEGISKRNLSLEPERSGCHHSNLTFA